MPLQFPVRGHSVPQSVVCWLKHCGSFYTRHDQTGASMVGCSNPYANYAWHDLTCCFTRDFLEDSNAISWRQRFACKLSKPWRRRPLTLVERCLQSTKATHITLPRASNHHTSYAHARARSRSLQRVFRVPGRLEWQVASFLLPMLQRRLASRRAVSTSALRSSFLL